MYSYIHCLHQAVHCGYPVHYESLYKFVLFDAKRRGCPPLLWESLRTLGRAYARRAFGRASYSVKGDINVLYDVTRLISHNTHSGISRVVWKIYQLLSTLHYVKVIPVFNYDHVSNIVVNRDPSYVFRYCDGVEIQAFEYRNVIKTLASQRNILYHSGYYPIPSDIPNGVKCVITVYDIIHLTDKAFYPDPGLFPTGRIAESCRNADMSLAISEYTAEELLTYLGADIPILPMPLASIIGAKTAHNEAVERNPRKIMTLGTQSGDPRKNLSRMLTVACGWLERSDEYEVCIFGDISKFKRQFAEHPILTFPRVELINMPDDEELRRILAHSGIYLYLSQAEGFGLPPIEAMLLGCPAIMLDNSSLGEVFRGWRGLVPNAATDLEILDRAEQVALDLTSSSAAGSFAANYSWELCLCLMLIGYALALDHTRS